MNSNNSFNSTNKSDSNEEEKYNSPRPNQYKYKRTIKLKSFLNFQKIDYLIENINQAIIMT